MLSACMTPRSIALARDSSAVQKLDLSGSTSVSHQGLVHRREYCGVLRWTMRLAMDPLRLLLISLAGWLNQQQHAVIDYLQEENRVLWRAARRPAAPFQRRPTATFGGQSQDAGPAHAA